MRTGVTGTRGLEWMPAVGFDATCSSHCSDHQEMEGMGAQRTVILSRLISK